MKPHSVAGVSLDGESAGQRAIADVGDLDGNADTCDLHQLQRSALFAVGLAGATSKNPLAKKLIKAHGRLVALSGRNRFFAEGLRKKQAAEGIPAHKTLTLVKTHAIRWGNQQKQMDTNCLCQPLIDPTLSSLIVQQQTGNNAQDPVLVDSSDYCTEVELNPATPAATIPKAAVLRRSWKAEEMSLTMSQWVASTHLSGFMEHLFVVKEAIEKKQTTSGMNFHLIFDLRAAAQPQQSLSIKALPESSSLKHRARSRTFIASNLINESVLCARKELISQIESRWLAKPPSPVRLVSLVLCKQGDWKDVLPVGFHGFAMAAYYKGLRSAASSLQGAPRGERTSPRKKAKANVSSAAGAGGPMLFRGTAANPPLVPETGDGDSVQTEAAAFAAIPESRWLRFVDKMGMLDEFSLFSSLSELPLHQRLFQMTACHLGHEGNVESSFSVLNYLEDPNMDVSFLGKLVSASGRKALSKPDPKRILREYESRWPDGRCDNTLHGLDDGRIEGDDEGYTADGGGDDQLDDE